MKAIRPIANGGPEVLKLEEVATPAPAAGQLLVETEVIGVNFIDVYQRTGLYKTPRPIPLGLEGTGIVAEVGPDVHTAKVGERVVWSSVPGSYATAVLVNAERAVPVPDGIDPKVATAAMLQGLTAHYLATEAGVAMLAAGGNAVDAAVAASLALGVCEPAGSGLGGMTVALIHLAQPVRTFVLGGACRAPRRATPDGIRGRSRYRGHHAVAVPTNAAVLAAALSRYGTLSRADVIAPAIRIAEQGFPLTTMQHSLAAVYRRPLRKWGAGRFFLDPAGQPLPAGSWMRQNRGPGRPWRLSRLPRSPRGHTSRRCGCHRR